MVFTPQRTPQQDPPIGFLSHACGMNQNNTAFGQDARAQDEYADLLGGQEMSPTGPPASFVPEFSQQTPVPVAQQTSVPMQQAYVGANMGRSQLADSIDLKRYDLKHRYASHLGLAVRKNLILKSRKPFGCCCEVMLPPFFMLLLALMFRLATTNNIAGEDYMSHSFFNGTELLSQVGCLDVRKNDSLYGDIPNPLRFKKCLWTPSDLGLDVPKVPVYPDYSGTSNPVAHISFDPVAAAAWIAAHQKDWGFRGNSIESLYRLFTNVTYPSDILHFDAYFTLQKSVTQAMPDSEGADLGGSSVFESLFHAGSLEFSYDKAAGGVTCEDVKDVIKQFSETTTLFNSVYNASLDRPGNEASSCPGVWEDEDTAVDFIKGPGADETWALLVLHDYDAGLKQLDYTIRMNYSAIPRAKYSIDRFSQGLGKKYYQQYVTSGFMSLQALMYSVVGSGVENVTTTTESSYFATCPMPTASYRQSDFYLRAGASLPLFMSFAFIYPVSRLVGSMVLEKEQRQREGMLIMGLSRFSFFSSWFVTYAILNFISAAVITLIVRGGLFKFSSEPVIFLLFWFFGMSMTAWSMMASTLFSKARIGATVSPFLMLSFTIPSRIVGSKASLADKQGLSLLAPSAFGYAAEALCGFEGSGEGAHFSNLHVAADGLGYSQFAGWAFLWLDMVLYLLLAWYLDHVLPSEWGVKHHPLFMFDKTYWGGSPSVKKSDGDKMPAATVAETYDEATHAAMAARERIRITDLTKKFSGKPAPAVNHLGHGMRNGCLSFYEGQIQCVLGHNGAGKTTLINMMTGMLAPDAGDCTIWGKSILSSMDEIRQDLGLCPQHNILWDELTSFEHLMFFGGLKGVPRSVLKPLADRMLDLVNLGTKKHAYAKTLSGGQKRKLSVAIALIGGPRLVFLDEPTAGMDVESRRAMWLLLRRPEILKDRCIVLTTHYMDEADLLGDNVVIMDQGCAHSQGSPFFLKQNLGVGYNLSIAMKTGCDIYALESAVRRYVPSAKALSCSGNELRMQLPMFLPLTDKGVTEAIPEEHPDADVRALRQVLLATPVEERLEVLSSRAASPLTQPSVKQVVELMTTAVRAQGVFPDLFETLENDKETLHIESFGVGVSTLEEVFMKIATESSHFNPTSPVKEVDDIDEDEVAPLSPDEGSVRSVVGARNSKFKLYSISDESEMNPPFKGAKLVRSQVGALFMKRLRYGRRDRRTLCVQFILPVFCVIFALLLQKLPLAVTHSKVLDISEFDEDFVSVPTASSLHQGPAFLDVLEVCNKKSSIYNADQCFFTEGGYGYGIANETVHNSSVASGVTLSQDLTREYHHHGGTLRPMAFSTYKGVSNTASSVLLLHNATWVSGLPTTFGVYLNAVLRKMHGKDARVVTRAHPLPLSNYFQEFLKSLQILLLGIVILLPFTIIPSNYVAFVVKERECKAKHLQLVSGLKIALYWAANFLFDIFAYMVTLTLVIIVFFADNRKEFVGSIDTFGGFFTLFVLYGISSIVCSYAASFLFNVHTQAQTTVSVGNFVAGFVFVMAGFIMDEVGGTTADVGKVLKYIFRFLPSYCLGEGIISLSRYASPFEELTVGDGRTTFAWDVVGVDLFYMGVSIPIYICILFALEFRREMIAKLRKGKNGPSVQHGRVEGGPPSPVHNPFQEDANVAKERAEVLNAAGTDRENDLVRVENLTKVWPLPGLGNYKTAVDDVTFGVKRGELFAFLGTNGAGKTTTLSCLSGEFPPTSGRAWIAGHNVETETRSARKNLGFCPQFDALLDHLTVSDHLELYSKLRGIPNAEARESADTLLTSLGLRQYKDVPSKSLSGGNRRKLSVAVALTGGPPVIFLDEPSAGMDPVARRGLWRALEDACRDRCVVLTTHHLEEVEGLSHLDHRVTIMVDSKLQCMGSLQQVKANFGDAYELEVKAKDVHAEAAVRAFIAATYPTSVLEEATSLRLTYKLPMPLRMSEVFRSIEKERAALGITDYSISATSLEQVFIRISQRAQRAEEGETLEQQIVQQQEMQLAQQRGGSLAGALTVNQVGDLVPAEQKPITANPPGANSPGSPPGQESEDQYAVLM